MTSDRGPAPVLALQDSISASCSARCPFASSRRTLCTSDRRRRGTPRPSGPPIRYRNTKCFRAVRMSEASGPKSSTIRVSVPHASGEATPPAAARSARPCGRAVQEALRRPVRQADTATWSDDPSQLGRGTHVVRREHDAERREHRIEGGVGKRQVFRIGRPEPRSTGESASRAGVPGRAARARSRWT